MIEVQLSDELKKLFTEQFLKPANALFASGKIDNPTAYDKYSSESIAIKNEHRKKYIDFGRGDFSKPKRGLKPSEQVDLYCYYYFQMHFSSSYAFYFKEKKLLQSVVENKHVLFLDIGCGPFTAGLAFNQWLTNFADMNRIDAEYYGADSSRAMYKRAWSVTENTNLNFGFISVTWEKNSFFLKQHTQQYFENLVVILNFSYLFGSESITVPDMVEFTNNVISHYRTPENEKTFQCIIFQQNPDYESLNKKWYEYKSQLSGFTSVKGYPQVLDFCFDDFMGNYTEPNVHFNVRCDVLKSR